MIIFNLPSNWNREIKDSQHFRSGFFDKQIADDGWRDRGVAGLPNADHGSHGKKRMVILKKSILLFTSAFVLSISWIADLKGLKSFLSPDKWYKTSPSLILDVYATIRNCQTNSQEMSPSKVLTGMNDPTRVATTQMSTPMVMMSFLECRSPK
jgi:hypothetical protein